jgi:hypothetical protein
MTQSCPVTETIELLARAMAFTRVGDPNAIDLDGRPRWKWFVKEAEKYLQTYPGHAPTPADAEVLRLRRSLYDIQEATIGGRVCDDVAWFDGITTLHDFCEIVLHGPDAGVSHTSTDGNCPRCKREPADKALLGSDAEGHICGTCWSNDRNAESSPDRGGK